MAANIEKLLRMTADYHNFCCDGFKGETSADPDEVTEEELFFVAAATGLSANMENLDRDKNNRI